MKYAEIYHEYESCLSQKNAFLAELSGLKEGCVSVKNISGKQYSYLQKKKNGKVCSEYIRKDDLEQVAAELRKRHDLEQAIELKNDQMDKLEAAAKLLDRKLYQALIGSRRCSLMDSLPLDIRGNTLEFGNAVAALEGIPVSKEVEENLSLWATGQYSYKDSFFQILAKYKLI